MVSTSGHPEVGPNGQSASCPGGRTYLWILLLLAIYAAGLMQGISRPWTGMHDWNGAFFSQLARNLLRYPASLHHGMPIVAVGEAVPPPQERSVYATHPPGLVWLVALSFGVVGESEWAARLVAVIASLGAMAMFVLLVDRGWGRERALIAGLFYAVMPMAVYFGRMVDHEAISLCLMLASMTAWQTVIGQDTPAMTRRIARIGWGIAITCAIWVDWSGVLFAGLFALHAVVQWGRRRIGVGTLLLGIGVPLGAGVAMVAYLVCAGLDGKASDLVAIFLSRSTQAEGEVLRRDLSAPGGVWGYTVANLALPILVLSAIGMLLSFPKRSPLDADPQPKRRDGTRAVDGAWILPATGIIWLVVFWRQYERHNYWLFYLGPAVALLAATGLSALRDRAMSINASVASGVLYAGAAVSVGFALCGTDDYYTRISYPPEEAAALQWVRQVTQPGDRVLLSWDPVLVEKRGGYRFRNLVPPQRAYYLDRAFDVERNPAGVLERAAAYPVYVIPVPDALRLGDKLAVLQARFPSVQVGSLVVFDLRPAGSQRRGTPASGGNP